MTEERRPPSVTVLDGDGLVVIRNSGEVLLAVNASRPSTEAQLLAIGLVMCLENDDWSRKLVERVVAKWRKEKGYDPRIVDRTRDGVASAKPGAPRRSADRAVEAPADEAVEEERAEEADGGGEEGADGGAEGEAEGSED